MKADSNCAREDGRGSRAARCKRMRHPSLDEVFDPKNNALNAWRLVLAIGVILWHSWPLTGRDVAFEPLHQLLRDAWVDGFFAISGFLITLSWCRRPRLRQFVVARGLRILPGLWVCLVFTAFVIAPVAVTIQRQSAASMMFSRAPFDYVIGNSAVWLLQHDIGGTPSGVPWSGEWNGSLWTLFWEMLCYITIAILGVTGLLRRKWLVPALLALMLYWSAVLPPYADLINAPPGARLAIEPATEQLVMNGMLARFAVMFLAGAMLYQLRTVIPARWSLAALSLVIVAAASLLPNYRVVAAVPLAYALVVSSALIRHPRMQLRTDLSYGMYIYAFPIQQLLVICGLAFLTPPLFALVASAITLPLAALSWFLVEKRAMSFKARLRRSG